MKNNVRKATITPILGGLGSANNQTQSPYGIAYYSATDTLYVADFGNSRVMCYTSGASAGYLAAGDGTTGKSITQLNLPARVYFDSFSNSLIIVNYASHNVVRWTLGATNCTLLAGDIHGNPGNDSNTLYFPLDVTLDPMGNMYVADRSNHRIQLYMNGQTQGITIAGVTGINGSASNLLYSPYSIKLDNQLNLYVSDFNNNRIQKFLRY